MFNKLHRKKAENLAKSAYEYLQEVGVESEESTIETFDTTNFLTFFIGMKQIVQIQVDIKGIQCYLWTETPRFSKADPIKLKWHADIYCHQLHKLAKVHSLNNMVKIIKELQS